MHFARTEEQDELATVVRALLDKRSDSAAVRAAMSTDLGYDDQLWQALCEQVGVAALPIPEEYDGVGASLVETAIVLEELGRNLAPAPLLATALATAALLVHGDEDACRDLLPRIAAGVVATVHRDAFLLEPGAPIVLDATADELLLYDELHVARVGCLDPTIRLGVLDSGHVNTVGTPVDHRALTDVGWALTSALQVGTAQRGLEMTVAYTQEREQFGRPIGSFQALKHRMAEMLVRVEASRSASWGATAAAAAYVLDPGERTAATLRRRAAVARSYCTEALQHVAAETVQLHGGIAITWEHDAQLVLKRAQALALLGEPAHVARASLV